MAKRIVLTSFGSYGDLHPFFATALALKARGFEVLIAAQEDYRAKAEAAGLDFRAAGPSAHELTVDTGIDSRGMVRAIARSAHPFLAEKAVVPYLERTYGEMSAAMSGADLLVASSYSIAARLAAARSGVPTVSLLLQPCVFVSAEEPPSMMEAPWLPALRRGLGAWAVRALMNLGFARYRWRLRPIAKFRRRIGLPPSHGDEVLDVPLRADWVAAIYSPLLGPLPPEAPARAEIVGYSFYDSEGGEAVSLPPAIDRFLAEGPAPLVFTLGSWAIHAPGRFYECAAEAAGRLGMRALLLVGRDAEARFAHLASDRVLVAAYAPHSLVFPRAAANIHHGGIGTVGQALRAGRPQLICPVLGDQLDNAVRLVRLGVARKLDHKRLNVERLTATLADLLGDAKAGDRAARLGSEVAKEDGPGRVADRIVTMLA
jgi:UDP:flavonoid glycosyltransferase YjiC (YdhE family)